MVYVFDSSFVCTLILPDEKNPIVDRIQDSIGEDEEIFVPQLLWYEVANVFKNLIRRKRYTFDDAMRFFPLLAAIRLTSDFATEVAYSETLLRLCDNYNLSSYDAAYLELAARKKAVLCTLDENLRNAAEKHHVVTLK
ncbi:MAG: type II toxin-antitoxin system VapC family toxin [Treponema sp.]|nr:type II toxin-antitoxin system VapC family toxin [Treponema sp.]